MQKLRMGIIGSGGISRGHGKRLSKRGVDIAAIAEPSEAMVASFAEAVYGTPHFAGNVYTNHKAMLDAEDLNAVLIASPHTCHAEQLIDSLDCGLHVLCEKPMVCSAAEGEQVLAKAKEVGKEIVISYQRRFKKNFNYMKQFVNSSDFGKILMIQAFQSQSWLTSQQGKWRQDPALSGGGQLHDSGSHLVDILLWMLPDKPVEVSAMVDNRGTQVDIDSLVNFKTENGTMGTITILGSAPHGGMWEDITFSGDSGQSIYIRKNLTKSNAALGEQLQDVEDFGDYVDGDADNHFIDVILGDAKNQSPPEDYLNVIKFTQACWDSGANGGQPIKID